MLYAGSLNCFRTRTGRAANQDEENLMAKKSKAQATKAQEPVKSDEDLADAVRDAAEKIWLAGLGAFAKSRWGTTKSFEALVREGESLHSRTHTAADGGLPGVDDGYRRALHQGSGEQVPCDRLEQVFEDRVARSLARLGVPSASAIRELTVLLEALTDRIDMIDSMPPPGPTTVSGPATAGTAPAAKPAKAARATKARAPSGTAAADKT
jgi:poly(hydroxyalkanoate) granule-associated protein